MVSTTWSEKSPPEAIQFPRWGSSRLENGLNNLGWETWCYELRPFRGHTHSFHNSGGGKHHTSACERRSLLTGISHGELSRRETRSENHTRPGQNGATSTAGPHPGALSLEPPGAYRRSLGHVCTIASSPSGAGWVREYQRGQCDVWWVANRSTCAWPKTLQICFTTSGWSSFPGPRPLASTECLLLHWDAQEYRLLSARETCPGTTQGSGAPACIRGERRPPGGWYKKPQLCCRCVLAHCDYLGPEGKCFNARNKTRTKVSSTCPRHAGIAAWPWSCETGFPSGWTPWTWATTVGVSCTAGQKVSRWTQDPAVIETAWPWVTGLLWLSWPVVRIDSIRAGDNRACIVVESHTTPR